MDFIVAQEVKAVKARKERIANAKRPVMNQAVCPSCLTPSYVWWLEPTPKSTKTKPEYSCAKCAKAINKLNEVPFRGKLMDVAQHEHFVLVGDGCEYTMKERLKDGMYKIQRVSTKLYTVVSGQSKAVLLET